MKFEESRGEEVAEKIEVYKSINLSTISFQQTFQYQCFRSDEFVFKRSFINWSPYLHDCVIGISKCYYPLGDHSTALKNLNMIQKKTTKCNKSRGIMNTIGFHVSANFSIRSVPV